MKIRVKHLYENSESYYENASVYEELSNAEDYPEKVLKILIPLVKNKVVLDLGCGTGKYLKLLAHYSKAIIGVDVSPYQMVIAKRNIRNIKNARIIHVSAEKLTLKKKSVDVVIGCWFLGGVLSVKKRIKIIKRIEHFLKDNGYIYLVENDLNSEFERIRGRTNDPLKRTWRYNNWLINKMGFKIHKRTKTYFKFKDKKRSKYVIKTIWGERAGNKVRSNVINHNVVIFKKQKKALLKI